MTDLKIKNLSYKKDNQLLLSNIDLICDTTGIHAVLGVNGAGKSLLLALMHGLIQPSSGSIRWAGQNPKVTKKSRGFVFQNPVVMRRSVLDNVTYPLFINKTNKSERIERAKAILDQAQLTTLINQPAAILSGGECQRMAIARALITNPATLLLDEPCSNLDPASTRLIEAMIHEFTNKGGTVFITTHDIRQANRIADQVLYLDSGRLIEQTSADKFFAGPSSVQGQQYLNGDT